MEGNTRLFKEIQDILHLSNVTPDTNLLRSKIVDFLFRRVYAENSVFFLPDPSGSSKGGMEINIDEKYVRQYKEYYHRYDPIQCMDAFQYRKTVVRLEDLIDYGSFMNSRFYCEFLKPQKIHHKLYINLYSGNSYHGRIAMYRPAKSDRFSNQDVHALQMISPYLGHALDHHALFLRNKVRNVFLDLLDEHWSRGIILFNESMQFIYMNQMAKDFCRKLNGDVSSTEAEARIPPMLLKDCLAMADELRRCPDDCLLLPRRRALRSRDHHEFSVSSRLLSKGVASEIERFFMISIQEKPGLRSTDRKRLREAYKLTDREIEIVRHIFYGMRNMDIAERLFLSEITVKKHIQHTFQKLEVKSRTALIHKILVDRQDTV